jgi:uncharacterized protein
VWDFLMDVPRVAECMPGLEAFEPLGDDRYRGALSVPVGPVRLALDGVVTVTERDASTRRAAMRAEAKDRRLSGGMRATLTVRLVEADAGTEVQVAADATVLGRIGELGQPVIRRKADELMATFAANLARGMQRQ